MASGRYQVPFVPYSRFSRRMSWTSRRPGARPSGSSSKWCGCRASSSPPSPAPGWHCVARRCRGCSAIRWSGRRPSASPQAPHSAADRDPALRIRSFVQVGAFAGAAAALVAVLAIHRSDSLSPILTLVLAGVVVSAFCSALVGLVTYIADPDTKLPDIVFWLLGSFASATWSKFRLLSVCTALSGVVLIGMRWRINVLLAGRRGRADAWRPPGA